MELPIDLLDRPADEAVRRIALALVARTEAAALRLAAPTDADPEALHDFRVGVRRLRSCLRAYRAQLETSLPRRYLSRLRQIADATNPGRDAEVQAAWLAGERRKLRPHERPGLDWLAARLATRQAEAYAAVRNEVLGELSALAPKLARRLSHYRLEIAIGDSEPASPRFRTVLAAALAAHAEALRADLARVTSLADEHEAHAARIEAKRLRYLLEPLAGDSLPAARPAVKRLRGLQDLLGELNDAHLLAEEIGRATAEAAATRARQLHELALAGAEVELARARRRSERSGLLTLAARLAAHRQALFARLQSEWLGGRAAATLDAELSQLGDELTAGPGAAPVP